jgi:hypothetical protein
VPIFWILDPLCSVGILIPPFPFINIMHLPKTSAWKWFKLFRRCCVRTQDALHNGAGCLLIGEPFCLG